MKRTLSFEKTHEPALLVLGTALVAATYGLVRLAYGLFLPDIQASLDLGDRAAGYVSSGGSLAYCLGALAGLVAGTRPRLLVVGALVTASGGAAGMALATGTAWFAALAVVSSAGAGLASPGLVAIVARNVPAVRRDRAQAVVNAGTGPGLVAAGVLALVLLPEWRLAFAVSTVLTAAAAVGVLLLDRPHPGLVPAADPDGEGQRTTTVGGRTWTPFLVPATAALLLGAGSAVVWTYGRSHLVASGASPDGSTMAWVALGAGGTATVLTARWLSRLGPARAWAVTALSTAVAIGALGLVADRLVPAAVACAVFGWGFVAATSALIAWAGEIDADRAAAGTSLLFVTLVLGQAAGSSVAGGLAQGAGLAPAFALAAVVTAVGAALGVRRPHRRPTDPCVVPTGAVTGDAQVTALAS